MMPRGFKPVGWVAAVGGAALGCYMLSLNVAAERAELAKVERQIVLAKTEIRSLQTELGTRGRLEQLEHWNAEVLALSAPAAPQFVDNEMMLARFETHEPTIEEKSKVQLASMPVDGAGKGKPAQAAAKKLAPADFAAAARRAPVQDPAIVRQAAYVPGEEKPAVIKAAVEKPATPAKAKAAKADAAPAKAPKVAVKDEIASEVGGQ